MVQMFPPLTPSAPPATAMYISQVIICSFESNPLYMLADKADAVLSDVNLDL